MFDSFELNKIVGAILFSLLVMMGVGIVAETVYHVEEPSEQGYPIEVAEQTGGAGAEEEEAVPLAQLLANADAGRGEAAARKCLACHTFEDGGANKVGPNLFGVVGAEHAHLDNFSYSDAMQSQEGPWTYERLDAFLASPREAIPGTAMAFAGVRDAEERADLLMYLRSVSPDAPPLPEPEAAPAEDGDDGEQAATENGEGGDDAGADAEDEGNGDAQQQQDNSGDGQSGDATSGNGQDDGAAQDGGQNGGQDQNADDSQNGNQEQDQEPQQSQ